jgi:hypothetical protein
MQLLEKVKDNPNICSVELGFSGELSASSIPDWQPFYNSSMFAIDFTQTHIGLGSVAFSEESQESPAGTSYKQNLVIRFPATDANRSQRIALMDKVRFVKIKLTNGEDLVIGRNDFLQNARPRIKIKTNIKTAEVEFETVSIFPAGFVSDIHSVGLPTLIPISLYL